MQDSCVVRFGPTQFFPVILTITVDVQDFSTLSSGCIGQSSLDSFQLTSENKILELHESQKLGNSRQANVQGPSATVQTGHEWYRLPLPMVAFLSFERLVLNKY